MRSEKRGENVRKMVKNEGKRGEKGDNREKNGEEMGEEAEKTKGKIQGKKMGGKPGEERENREKRGGKPGGKRGKKIGRKGGELGKSGERGGVADDFGVTLCSPIQGISWTMRCSCRTCLSGTGGLCTPPEIPSPSGDPTLMPWGVWGVLGPRPEPSLPPGSCVPAPATVPRPTLAGSPGGSTASTSSPRYGEHWESPGEGEAGGVTPCAPPPKGGDVWGDSGRAWDGERGAAGRVPGAPEGDFLGAGAPLPVRGIWGGPPNPWDPKIPLNYLHRTPPASWTCPRRSWGSPPTASSTSRPGCRDGTDLGR